MPFVGDLLLARTYGADEVPSFELAKYKMFATSIAYFENIVSAIWLAKVANRNGAFRLVWLLFGLVYGIWAIAIYYLIGIYEKLSSSSSINIKNIAADD